MNWVSGWHLHSYIFFRESLYILHLSIDSESVITRWYIIVLIGDSLLYELFLSVGQVQIIQKNY